MNRVELARRMGLRATKLRCVTTGRSYVRLACRCGRHSRLGIPFTGPFEGDHLLGMLDCPCLPPLSGCFSRQELHRLLDVPWKKESPRRGEELDEGRVVQGQFNDSAADIAPQSRFLGEGNDLACARHGDREPEDAA